jgi:hypothetical protein
MIASQDDDSTDNTMSISEKILSDPRKQKAAVWLTLAVTRLL